MKEKYFVFVSYSNDEYVFRGDYDTKEDAEEALEEVGELDYEVKHIVIIGKEMSIEEGQCVQRFYISDVKNKED